MNPEYNRFATPMRPGSQWPDGVPVSNWSQAVAHLILKRRSACRAEEIRASWCAGSLMLSAQVSILVSGLPQLPCLAPHD